MSILSCISVDSVTLPACSYFFFFLMIRRPPRSTLDRSSAASDVYKRQLTGCFHQAHIQPGLILQHGAYACQNGAGPSTPSTVSYTHLRAHETVLDLVCRLLLEKKKHNRSKYAYNIHKLKPNYNKKSTQSVTRT